MKARGLRKTAVVLVLALFAGSCGEDEAIGPETGSVQAALTMTGQSLDPDGCTITLDGGDPQLVYGGQGVTFSDLAVGSHVAGARLGQNAGSKRTAIDDNDDSRR